MDRAAFGALLREFRVSIGLTQADLAERARLSVRGISDLERGARNVPHPHTVRQLASALELTDEQLGMLLAAARPREVPIHTDAGESVEGPANSRGDRVAGATDFVVALTNTQASAPAPQVAAETHPIAGPQKSATIRWRRAVLFGAGMALVVVFALIAALVVSRSGPFVVPIPIATSVPLPSTTGELLLADTLANPSNGVFAHDQSGGSVVTFSDGASLTYQWDFAYMFSALVTHVLGPYPANPDGAWLDANTMLSNQPLPGDFAVQVRARVTRSPEVSAFGLGYESSRGQQYEFYVTPADQGFTMDLPQGEAPTAGHSTWILPPSQPNLLRMELRGETLRILANGHELAREAPVGLAARQGGAVSLRWAMTGPPSEGGSVEIRFAQFALYSLP